MNVKTSNKSDIKVVQSILKENIILFTFAALFSIAITEKFSTSNVASY